MFYEVLLLGQLEWNFLLFVFLFGITIVYSYVLFKFTSIRLFSKQPVLFFLSLILLYITIGSPLSAFSHLSFSLHMVHMSFLYFIVPPLILAGIPKSLFDLRKKIPLFNGIQKVLLTPKQALFLFSLLFLLYHLPVILNFLTQNAFFQHGYLFLLFILSFSLWWPIISPDPKQRLYNEKKKKYLLLSGLILMPACMLFILNAFIEGSQNPFLNQITAQLCLPSDVDSEYMNSITSPIHTKYDQMMAGVLMLGMHKFGMMLSSHLQKS